MRLAPLLIVVALLLRGASAVVAQSDEATLGAFETGFSRAIEKASAVTVSIKVDRKLDTAKGAARPGGGGFGSGGFIGGREFAVRPDAPVSGYVVDPDGWIATTYFNIQGELRGIEVTLPDGAIHAAKVMGWNVGADIALLKIEATGLPTLTSADPGNLRTGDLVVAVGRDPSGRSVTANPGILSAPGRQSGRSVQVDCRLNFGNVGGPLVDLDGRIVGMSCKVTLINAGDRGQNSGVGYVMLSSKIAEMLPSLKKGDRIQGGGGRPFLGVGPDPGYAGKDGAKLGTIVAGGSAEKAGLQRGDIIQLLDGDKVSNFDELRAAIMKHKIGDTVNLKVKRGDEVLDFEMQLGENPSE